MPLTDTAIKNAKPKPDKAYKLPDEKGLYLLVTVSGGGLIIALTVREKPYPWALILIPP